MISKSDVRWLQRFDNYSRALLSFKSAILLSQQRELSDLEKQGLIQSFEFCHELAWNTLKDLLEYQGISGMLGSRDVIKESFSRGLVQNGEPWIDMIKSRNLTSHTYNIKIANDIVTKIQKTYAPLFEELRATLEILKQHESI